MPLYTGTSADGSDMKEFEGIYTNPDNPDEFSSEPYPAQRRLIDKIEEIKAYMERNNLTIEQVKEEITNKTSKLSYKQREVVNEYA